MEQESKINRLSLLRHATMRTMGIVKLGATYVGNGRSPYT